MKKYKNGIIMGILSIIASLLIVGIPIGNSLLEIINIIVFISGLLVITYLGLVKNNDKYLLIFSLVYLLVLTALIGIIEIHYIDYKIGAVGFIIGLLLSIVGLVNSKRNKDKYDVRISGIVNVVALIIAFCSLGMVIFNNGGIIIGDDDCEDITGGGYNISFVTNSEEVIDLMHVCIACSPDSYSNLPEPKRDGYNFLGWYYDKKLTKKVNVSSTMDIDPVPNKNNKGCLEGYKDIELYAKWEKN